MDSHDFVRDGSVRYFSEPSKLPDHAVVCVNLVVGCKLGFFDGFCKTGRLERPIVGPMGYDGRGRRNGPGLGTLRAVLSPACDFGCGVDQLDERITSSRVYLSLLSNQKQCGVTATYRAHDPRMMVRIHHLRLTGI